MKKQLTTLILAASMLLSSAAFAAGNAFFEVGKTYLFIPRIDVVERGTVTQVTDQEVVFNNRSVLIASKKGGDAKAKAVKQYLDTPKKDRAKLLEPSVLNNVDISYSRANMTAILEK